MNDKMNLSQPKPATQPGPANPPAGRQVNRAVRAVAIAVAVVLALLGGLAAYETYNRDASPSAVSKAPAPAAPAAPEAAVEPAAPVAPLPAPVTAEAPAAEAAPAPVPQPEVAVAPERSSVSDGSAGKPAAEPRRRAADKATTAMTSTTTVGPITSQPDTRAAGVPGAWFVQAGVYNNLANAEAMRDKLAANGFPALMEIRVLAGPYPGRGEAQQAQGKLAELGIAPTLLVAPRKPASPSPGR